MTIFILLIMTSFNILQASYHSVTNLRTITIINHNNNFINIEQDDTVLGHIAPYDSQEFIISPSLDLIASKRCSVLCCLVKSVMINKNSKQLSIDKNITIPRF